MQDAPAKPNLLGLDRADLEAVATQCGEPRYRGRQIFHGLYARRLRTADSFTDLSKPFRQQLTARFEIAYPDIREKRASRDGAVRYLLGLADGQGVESVYMPENDRVTLCVSSQAGCAVDCRFCFTALMGLKRNLTAGEILGQALAIALDQDIGGQTRLNVVFMGMGEPLLNFGPVMKSVAIMSDRNGIAIPLRHITISTSGIVPRIEDLGKESARPRLAISLNASASEQRTAMMPLNRKYPLDALIEACRAYPLRPREKLTFEYVMLDGINDSLDDALRVAVLLRGLRAKVNLIPYNAGPDLPYRAPPFDRVMQFREALTHGGVDAFIRISRGQDVRAACGQLVLGGVAES
ncbi:MAG: 23S rRNA (adenine(2503)-C(2))-methyltransferase RlmN [Terriglobia bacterium]